MEPVVLTRDVLLDMPVDDLWRLVAEPDGLRLWLGDSVELDVRPGGVGTVRDRGHVDDESHADGDGNAAGEGEGDGDGDGIVLRHVRVDRVEPAHELAFTWWRTDDPDTASQASQVVFQLTAVPGGSHLLITETLLGPVPPTGITATAFACTAGTAWEVRVLSLWACSVAAALV
jgi:uncharacterized protein YndB with AHSA1/START domain